MMWNLFEYLNCGNRIINKNIVDKPDDNKYKFVTG
jgi:hypothetical protein